MVYNEMVDVIHPQKGRRRWASSVWEKLTVDSDGTTRGGGWRIIGSSTHADGEMSMAAKVSAAPIVKKKLDAVVVETVSETPEIEITEPNGEAIAPIEVIVPIEVVATVEKVVDKPKVVRKRSPRKKK